MARFGLEPGERVSLEERHPPDGSVEGYYVLNPASSSDGTHVDPVLILRVGPFQQSLTVHPLDTLHWRESNLGQLASFESKLLARLQRDVE